LFLDIHCHLNEFTNSLEIVEKARSAGVGFILTNAVDLGSMKKCIALTHQFKEVECALGLHPSNLLRLTEKEIEEALAFLKENIDSAVAVGEIGLDFKHAQSCDEQELQKKYFLAQLKIAERKNKPVVVHSRLAVTEAMLALKGFKGRILFHWFSGSLKELEQAVEMGGFFSVGPAVEFDRPIQEIAKRVPENMFFSETDAPVPFHGKRSDPSWVVKVVKAIAKLKGKSTEEIEKSIESNLGHFLVPEPPNQQ